MASVDGAKSLQVSSDESFEFECGPCIYECVKKESVIFCYQCDDYLCASCRSTHQKLPVTRNHQVVSGSSMARKKASKWETLSQNVGVKCSCIGKDITMYCKEHNDVMCVDCQRLKHRTCPRISIDDACTHTKLPNKEVKLYRD